MLKLLKTWLARLKIQRHLHAKQGEGDHGTLTLQATPEWPEGVSGGIVALHHKKAEISIALSDEASDRIVAVFQSGGNAFAGRQEAEAELVERPRQLRIVPKRERKASRSHWTVRVEGVVMDAGRPGRRLQASRADYPIIRPGVEVYQGAAGTMPGRDRPPTVHRRLSAFLARHAGYEGHHLELPDERLIDMAKAVVTGLADSIGQDQPRGAAKSLGHDVLEISFVVRCPAPEARRLRAHGSDSVASFQVCAPRFVWPTQALI